MDSDAMKPVATTETLAALDAAMEACAKATPVHGCCDAPAAYQHRLYGPDSRTIADVSTAPDAVAIHASLGFIRTHGAALRAAVEAMQWRPIEGWSGRYEVSVSGQVRRRNGKPLKQWKNSHGYMLVRLSNPRAVERVHRLVAKAFIPNTEAKPFVNHINNERADNRAENLEWCTQLENLAHADRQGRMQRDYWVGKRSPSAMLSDRDVAAIRAEYAAGGVSWAALGEKYGIGKRSIGRILKGESYAQVR